MLTQAPEAVPLAVRLLGLGFGVGHPLDVLSADVTHHPMHDLCRSFEVRDPLESPALGTRS